MRERQSGALSFYDLCDSSSLNYHMGASEY